MKDELLETACSFALPTIYHLPFTIYFSLPCARAITATATIEAPAFLSTWAASLPVAPVVSTSSTSSIRAPLTWLLERTRKAPRTLRNRCLGDNSSDCGRVFRHRTNKRCRTGIPNFCSKHRDIISGLFTPRCRRRRQYIGIGTIISACKSANSLDRLSKRSRPIAVAKGACCGYFMRKTTSRRSL